MSASLNFDLKLPSNANKTLPPELYTEFQILYNSVRILAEQVAEASTMDWIDYSATSTIVGWSSFTTKQLSYRYLTTDTVMVSFLLIGTSNNGASSFTVPSTLTDSLYVPGGLNVDAGVALASTPQIKGIAASSVINLYRDLIGTGWTNAGTKGIAGQFIYRSA